MRFIFLFLLIQCSLVQAQQNILFVGNTAPLFIEENTSFIISTLDSIPDSIEKYDAIFIFSGAVSTLRTEQIPVLLTYVSHGNGLYCGADNYPLFEEFNEISEFIFGKKVWGNFTASKAILAENSFLNTTKNDSIDAGETTVAIPLDARVRVEAWIEDEPIITSLQLGKGKIVFDGGYSRFFNGQKAENRTVFDAIVQFLLAEK